ncbi:NADH-quinone oxidoreductase subunit C/D [bacterium endosymbiont of Pedicinus badii]|uniref:NADH-quinone oxidoreductase subunit C/D n=1 Tax=bacterium endosymbiont of Pedicinus badii TaxID=1719126 RepID=UPI0009B94DE7|nr:NADH-quinone oxidoreductase subunit C/D [bacterium endosymbiont of Pedicinus badii]OQM34455.1 NADH:ubiquinone oxidoreductase [bacterium endosymbiont of Pedicinus badii]
MKYTRNYEYIVKKIQKKFSKYIKLQRKSAFNFPVFWVRKEKIKSIILFLKSIDKPYNMLYDLHAIDERFRRKKFDPSEKDFTVFYHLLSIDRNDDILLKVALIEEDLNVPTITKIFKNANWYERETWEMFGIFFENHPNLTRILMPKSWVGHPLRKDYSAKATEQKSFFMNSIKERKYMQDLEFDPSDWNMKKNSKKEEFMFLNLGPNHPSVHGVFRIILQLKGEEIINCAPDIGYHHRGAEKIGEIQSWHSYIPYTDRIEYLGGCINEMPYILAIEKIENILITERAKTIRVLLSELFRINSHLLYIGTYIQDLGCMSPIFLTFFDRKKIYDIIEFITGARMHPAWFRIGGIANDLPNGWENLIKSFLSWIPKRLKIYRHFISENKILVDRTKKVASYDSQQAIEWGVTGSSLRATGIDFDIRKKRPYSGYENFDFEIPIGNGISDCYTRAKIKLEEIHESCKIVQQCLENMPKGEIKSDHYLTTPPKRDHTLYSIETLITHFLHSSWGPIISENESLQMVEATKGINSYYIISDGGICSYRTRIRTPSFPHLQQIPSVINGSVLQDLIAYLGSIDFVMSDVDR